jgi:hypothetical protein
MEGGQAIRHEGHGMKIERMLTQTAARMHGKLSTQRQSGWEERKAQRPDQVEAYVSSILVSSELEHIDTRHFNVV